MSRHTILLVDDDADLLQVLSARCEAVGFSVLHARNLLTANVVLEKCVPDLICVDVNMPTGNGLRFCEMVVRDPRLRSVQLIVLTGSRDANTIDTCSRLGVHYLGKSGDVWLTLEPLLQRLIKKVNAGNRADLNIRSRNSPAHLIPTLPEDAKVGADLTGGLRLSEGMPAGTPKERPLVLVADDDAELVATLCQRLNELGCTAIGVGSPLDAAREIYRSQPQLVILDVNMPAGSGLGICEMLVTDKTHAKIPVIILSGSTDERVIRRCHDMLVFYVQKNADVWRRIEPLVQELLKLNDSVEKLAGMPQAREKNREASICKQSMRRAAGSECRRAGNAQPPSASAEPIDEHEDDSLIDAVFAMLGRTQGEEMAVDNPASSYAAVATPWILCIDDDHDFSEAIKLRLHEYGVAVSRAANGMAGYWMAYTTRAAAILLDYHMPNGQGDYILRRLKDNPMTRDIPVIMITGVKDRMLERRVMAMGAKAYLLKPVSIDQLCTVLSDFIPTLRQPDSKRPEMATKR